MSSSFTDQGHPILLTAAGVSPSGEEIEGTPQVFRPIDTDDADIREGWLQKTLFQNPGLLPITEVDQVFAPVRMVAREVPTGVGRIDLLGVSPRGFLTIIETKLHRNRESRREVLGQILDYCAQLSRWSYDDLVEAARSARCRTKDDVDPLWGVARDTTPSASEYSRFRATVAECLRHGRFLMLIVGDDFRDATEELVDFVQKYMHLQFTIRLVEMQLYRPSGAGPSATLVVPRVALRTQEVTRAIVRIERRVEESDIAIEGVKDQPTSPGFEGFMEELRRTSGVAEEFASFVAELAPLGVYPDPIPDGVALRFPDPGGTGQQFRIARVRRKGTVRLGLLRSQLENRGYSTEPALSYLRAVATWIEGARVNDQGTLVGADGRRLDVPLATLMRDKGAEFNQLVRQLLDDIQRAANEASKQ